MEPVELNRMVWTGGDDKPPLSTLSVVKAGREREARSTSTIVEEARSNCSNSVEFRPPSDSINNSTSVWMS